MKIIVDSQEKKDALIAESAYIHDYVEVIDIEGDPHVFGLDTDKAPTLTHIYTNPDMIEVRPPKIFK